MTAADSVTGEAPFVVITVGAVGTAGGFRLLVTEKSFSAPVGPVSMTRHGKVPEPVLTRLALTPVLAALMAFTMSCGEV